MLINLTTKAYNYRENLQAYFEEIRKIPRLSKEEEKKLLERLYVIRKKYEEIKEKLEQNGYRVSDNEIRRIGDAEYGIDSNEENELRNKIVLSNLRYAISVARVMANNKNVYDLIEEANLSLFEALDHFNPTEYDNSFITFATHYIRRNLNLYIVNKDRMVKKSNGVKTYSTLAKAKDMFIQEYNRQPSPDEIKEYLYEKMGVSVQNIDVIDMNVSSIDEWYEDDEGNRMFSNESETYNKYTVSKNDYEDNVDSQYNQKIVTYMISKLKPRDKEVIEMSYGIGCDREYEIQEIAEKLKITTERVRQIKNEAIERMKRENENILTKMV